MLGGVIALFAIAVLGDLVAGDLPMTGHPFAHLFGFPTDGVDVSPIAGGNNQALLDLRLRDQVTQCVREYIRRKRGFLSQADVRRAMIKPGGKQWCDERHGECGDLNLFNFPVLGWHAQARVLEFAQRLTVHRLPLRA